MIRPIKRVSISEQVFEQLEQSIFEGDWTLGQKLPSENELSQKFGVSRVTIRNALQKLTVLGLVETRLGQGSYVKEFEAGNYMNTLVPMMYLGKNSTMETLEFRQVLETETAGLAALRATDEDIVSLKEALSLMLSLKGDELAFAEADVEFHRLLAQFTRNSLIIKTNIILNDVLRMSMQDIVNHMGYDIGIYYHEKILHAVVIHDRKAASKLMHEHLDKTIERYQDSALKKI